MNNANPKNSQRTIKGLTKILHPLSNGNAWNVSSVTSKTPQKHPSEHELSPEQISFKNSPGAEISNAKTQGKFLFSHLSLFNLEEPRALGRGRRGVEVKLGKREVNGSPLSRLMPSTYSRHKLEEGGYTYFKRILSYELLSSKKWFFLMNKRISISTTFDYRSKWLAVVDLMIKMNEWTNERINTQIII